MPIHPYDPNAEDGDDAEIHDINDLIERILHNGLDSGLGRHSSARPAGQ